MVGLTSSMLPEPPLVTVAWPLLQSQVSPDLALLIDVRIELFSPASKLVTYTKY